MSRRSKEEWERQKWYLIRSLFEDLPLLSPIPETQEQTFLSRSPLDVPVDRPYSPLPELIIEKELNRHDEPDEYYQYLEKKVKKIYRKLFFSAKTSSMDDSIDKNINDIEDLDLRSQNAGQAGYEHFELDIHESEDTIPSFESTAISSDPSSIESDNNANNLSPDSDPAVTPNNELDVDSPSVIDKESGSEVSDKSNLQGSAERSNTTASEIPSLHATIVTQADIHQLEQKQSELENVQGAHEPRLSTQTVGTGESNERDAQAEVDTSSVVSDNSEQNQSREEQEFQELANNREAILEFTPRSKSTNDSSSNKDVPETMRRQTCHSKSLQNSAIITEERDLSRINIEKECAPADINREMEIAEESFREFSVILGTTSSPRHIHAADESSKRTVLSEISENQSRCSPKRRRRENLAVQTSFSVSDDEAEWQRFKHNFFEGIPSIYRLCSCSNHNCC